MKKETMIFLALSGSLTAAAQDSTMVERWLEDAVVTARRPLYRMRADVMIYDVSADSSMVDKTAFDALRNAPLLITERSGAVRPVNGMEIEYLLNGRRDKAQAGNIHDASEALEARHLLRIEVRIERGVDGGEMLQVNLVTRGRLTGYRGTVNSTLTDASWRNGTYLYAKRGSWGLSAWYSNTWSWGHTSTRDNEEWREGQAHLHHISRSTKEGGYRCDLNNIEVDLCHEFTPLSVFSIYGRGLLKANPHSDATTTATAVGKTGTMGYRYEQARHHDVKEDGEYTLAAEYEKLFGENAGRGKFFAAYEFYRRPVKAVTDETFTAITTATPLHVQDFFNMHERCTSVEDWHTANVLYRRKMHGHEIHAEVLLRYRDEGEAVWQEQSYDYAPAPHVAHDWSEYSHRQLMAMVKAGYGYSSRRFQARAGGTGTFMHDRSVRKELDDDFSSDRRFLTPWADITLLPTPRTILRLSYTMARQVPDVAALNPYIHTNVPGEVTYGNPGLKPQVTHSLSLSSSTRAGRANLNVEASGSLARHLILSHSFLQDGLLNITKDNMGLRRELRLQASASSRLWRGAWGRIDASVTGTAYAATRHYAQGRGCTFTLGTQLQQELPWRLDLQAGGGFNTPWIYIQGRGGRNYHYSLRLDRNFPRQRLSLGVEARSFIPLRHTRREERRSEGYFSLTHERTRHASFALSLRWRFGRLKAEERRVEEAISHDDIKRSYEQ